MKHVFLLSIMSLALGAMPPVPAHAGPPPSKRPPPARPSVPPPAPGQTCAPNPLGQTMHVIEQERGAYRGTTYSEESPYARSPRGTPKFQPYGHTVKGTPKFQPDAAQAARQNAARPALPAPPSRPARAKPPADHPTYQELNAVGARDSRHDSGAPRVIEEPSAFPPHARRLRALETKYREFGKNFVWKAPPGRFNRHMGFVFDSPEAAQILVGRDIAGFSSEHGGVEFSGRVLSIRQDPYHPGVYRAEIEGQPGPFQISGVHALWVKEPTSTVVNIPPHPSGAMPAAPIAQGLPTLRNLPKADPAHPAPPIVAPERVVAASNPIAPHAPRVPQIKSEPAMPVGPPPPQVVRESPDLVRVTAGTLVEYGREIPVEAMHLRILAPDHARTAALRAVHAEGYQLVSEIIEDGVRKGYIVTKGDQHFTLSILDIESHFPPEAGQYPGAEEHGHDWRHHPDRAVKEPVWKKKAEEDAALYLSQLHARRRELTLHGQDPIPEVSLPGLREIGATLRPRAKVSRAGDLITVHAGTAQFDGRMVPISETRRRVVESGKAAFEAVQILRRLGYTLDLAHGTTEGGTRAAYILSKDGKRYKLKIQNVENYFPVESRNYPGAKAHDHDWRFHPQRAEKEAEWRRYAEERAAIEFNFEFFKEETLGSRGFNPIRSIREPGLAELGATLQPFAGEEDLGQALIKHPELENDPVIKSRLAGLARYDFIYQRIGTEYYGVTSGYEAKIDGKLVDKVHGIDMKPNAFHPTIRWNNTRVTYDVDEKGKAHNVKAWDIDW